MNIIHEIPPHFDKNCFVSLDTEFFGMDKKKLHRPTTGKFACLTICPNDEDVYIITEEEKIKPALESMEDCVWVTQMGKFDFTQLRRYTYVPIRKKWWDIGYLERIMYGGYFDTFDLASITRRTLDIYLEKETRKMFESAKELNEDTIYYACKDAQVTRAIGLEQRKKIDKNDFKVWTEIDRPFTWAVMDFKGFPIDTEQWLALASYNKQKAEEIGCELPFNFRSWQQIKKWAWENGAKIPATDEDTLTEFVTKNPDHPATPNILKILEAKSYSTLASKYGTGWQEFFEEEDGYTVVHPDINPIGAETGRTSASNPNIQQVPREPEFRKCFKAPAGYKLIIADYSAQEPRITAHVTQDKKLLDIFKNEKDVYIEMDYEIFGERITKKDKDKRNKMKGVFLGMTYGLSEFGFAKQYNILVEEAKMLLGKAMSTFPNVVAWQSKQYKSKKYVETVCGRKAWINPYSDQANRNKLNSPIQGTAADQMKKSIAEMHQTWAFDPIPFGLVAPVHDEVVLCVPDEIAKDVAVFTKNVMERVAEAMCPSVPFIADVCIGESWADKQ